MALTLGIDGGASSTKWALRSSDGTFIEGSTSPIDGHVYREESRTRLISVLREIKKEAGNDNVTAIYAGITGIGTESVSEVKKIIASEFLDAKIAVVIDMVLGYESHFALGEGIFLYAGTGSIAIHLTESGEIVRAGGWGYLLGDEGAGYWVGREAIRRTVAALDMKIELETFEIEILNALNVKNWDEIKAFVYSHDRSSIAALAPRVISMAQEGIETAEDILLTAAEYLADLVQQIEIVTGKRNLPVVIGGGISEAGTLLINAIERGIGRDVKTSNINMARRAAELAG